MKRLNKFIRGYEFSDADVYVLYEICAYEDAVTGANSPLYVPSLRPDFSCGLFTPLEFLAFEYLDDIWFQQFDGPANKFSAILGYFLGLKTLKKQCTLGSKNGKTTAVERLPSASFLLRS